MIVACEKCNNRFSVDESLVREEGTSVQCSRCSHEFMVFPPPTGESDDSISIDEMLRELTPPDQKAGLHPSQSGAFVPQTRPEGDIPPKKDEELFDIDTLDLPDLSEFQPSSPGEKGAKDIAFEPKTAAAEDELEFVLGDDFEIDDKLSTPQNIPAPGQVELDLSDLEEILRPERKPEAEKSREEEPPILTEEPSEPPIDFDIEILDDTVTEAADTTKTTEAEKLQREETLAEADIIDELDLTETPAEIHEKAKIPKIAVKPKVEAPSKPKIREVEIAAEEKQEDWREKAPEPDQKAGPRVFEKETALPEAAEIPPETFSLSAKTSKSGSFSLVLLILVLIGGAVYGAYVLTNRMGVSVPILSELFKTESSDPGNLKVRILDAEGRFITSPEHGKRFVISGKVVNEYAQAREKIQVSGKLLKGGQILTEEKSSFCGNLIPDTELILMDMNTIDTRLSEPAGGTDATLGKVQPGQGAPFMIVFGDLSQPPDEYSLAVIGSAAAP